MIYYQPFIVQKTYFSIVLFATLVLFKELCLSKSEPISTHEGA